MVKERSLLFKTYVARATPNIMTQNTLEAQASQNFDAIAFELQHASDYEKAQDFYCEIISYFNANEGIHIFEIANNCEIIGEYHRDPWSEYWIVISSIDGCKVEFDTDTDAIDYLKRLYLSTCC